MSKLIKTDADYSRWIQELKERYRCAQIKAATRVNQELLRSIGRLGVTLWLVTLKTNTALGLFPDEFKSTLPTIEDIETELK